MKTSVHVLTVDRLWAWAIIHGPKRVENRTWATKYRGRIAIHAGGGRKALEREPETRRQLERLGLTPPADPPSRAIIGFVDVVDVVEPDARPGDPFASGPKCWELANVEPAAEPIPLRGMPGLFRAEIDLPT